MDKYLTTESIDISKNNKYPPLELEYVLQRYRDVWVVDSKYPYLMIDESRLQQYIDNLKEFAVFPSSSILFQNINANELGQRLITSLAGSGLTAGNSPNGNVVVEGRANPQAHELFSFNPMLQVGTHPFRCIKHSLYICNI